MSELSVQLYTLRKALEQDFDGTLQRLVGFGFTQVEPFQLPAVGAIGYATGLSPKRAGCANDTCWIAQREIRMRSVGLAVELGIQTIVEPYVDLGSLASRGRHQRESHPSSTKRHRRAARYGLRVGYHNHHFELESKISGVHALGGVRGSARAGGRAWRSTPTGRMPGVPTCRPCSNAWAIGSSRCI